MNGFANIDSVFGKKLKSGQNNTKMTLCKIYNEVIPCMAKIIRKKIQNILKNTSCNTLITDEGTDDYTNKGIPLICLRIVQNLMRPLLME